jgi:hypothetical protein
MKRNSRRIVGLILAPLVVLLASGCDAADIVFASLDLAGAIVDAAVD